MSNIEILDCTLRDGAYIVNAEFGSRTISGIVKKLQESKIEIIECGWLKDFEHKIGTSYYHVPSDFEQYMRGEKSESSMFVAMIDYNRYDVNNLPICDQKSIDAIRVVFPYGKVNEAIYLAEKIRDKGYKIFLQAANTLGYSDYDLLVLAEKMNSIMPEGVSIVDTFGAMYPRDLLRISTLLNNNLETDIRLGFHSHNNQQLSFALSMQFVHDMCVSSNRKVIIDSSLCGMGRGAGNTNTELMVNFLNRNFNKNYDLNILLDTIDCYMDKFQKEYKWGYSIPYMIAGMYGCHVNNISYLKETHSIKNKDMRVIFSQLSDEKRKSYDYDNLEKVYNEYSKNEIDDGNYILKLKNELENNEIVSVLPGKSSNSQYDKVKDYIRKNDCIVIGINSILEDYKYDYLFFSNSRKYEFAKDNAKDIFDKAKIIITSNIESEEIRFDYKINYNSLQKYEWKYYENSMIMFLRLMKQINPKSIHVVGFDGYLDGYREKYSPSFYTSDLREREINRLQSDIESMLKDFNDGSTYDYEVDFITESPFEKYFIRGE